MCFALGFRQAASAVGFAALIVVSAEPAPSLAQPRATTSAPAKTGECAQLPGGRAPVLKIVNLTAGLSPRDLDLVYFGKPLAELTDEDFTQIAELSKRCGAGEGILPEDKQQAFRSVIQAAQQIRRTALDKVKRQMTEIQTLPVARDKIDRLNMLSDNLPLLEPTLTRGDLKYTASWITRHMQEVYDKAPKAPAVPKASVQPLRAASLAPGDAPAGSARPFVPGREED